MIECQFQSLIRQRFQNEGVKLKVTRAGLIVINAIDSPIAVVEFRNILDPKPRFRVLSGCFTPVFYCQHPKAVDWIFDRIMETVNEFPLA